MAEFEDNPFADPKQINPFAVSNARHDELSAFTMPSPSHPQDPSVQQASEPQPSTEEYNPFAEEVAKEPEVGM